MNDITTIDKATATRADHSADPACGRAPMGLLAELTHKCPLQCPYCSNPLEMDKPNTELSTEDWQRVFREAASLGILQLHLSGGEPTARKDLEALVKTAAEVGLYSNLITAGVLLTRERLVALQEAGLDHLQLSIQDVDDANAERISAYKGGMAKKRELAGWMREIGMPLTVNAPIHRANIENLPAIIEWAVAVGAQRLEVAHVQYYAWALRNRASLMPSRDQVMKTVDIVDAAKEKYKGIMVFDFVVPDYYARRPKPCMGGWGRGSMNITPAGKVLPCHAAESIPGLQFDNVRDKSLSDIWLTGQAFEMYRGTSWMKDPCRSCDRREVDWGGCRCQAMMMSGDPTNVDPACELSPLHDEFKALAGVESDATPPPFIYRKLAGLPSN
ncbi:MAG: pyrroloquinoline quinone biosynthesis protein PqqE [Hyphomicrobiaceae bacterium]|nr:pyrroloquinoline quinone biosynthesis protein PqqE [Hyphomicrobiaceae bacterium]